LLLFFLFFFVLFSFFVVVFFVVLFVFFCFFVFPFFSGISHEPCNSLHYLGYVKHVDDGDNDEQNGTEYRP